MRSDSSMHPTEHGAQDADTFERVIRKMADNALAALANAAEHPE